MPSSLPVLRASPSEKILKLAMVSFSGSGIFRQHRIDLAQRIARSLRHALSCAGFGDQRRHLAGICDQHAAFQRNHRNAGQALEFQTDLGVGSHRRRRRHRDRRVDAARIVRRQAEIRHLADADAVEQHRRRRPEVRAPSHRTGRGRSRADRGRRYCEANRRSRIPRRWPPARRRRQRQRERGFPSLNSLSVAASGSACRGNRPAPRDARIEAARASVRSRRSCRRRAPRRGRRRY